ncbi:MAG: tRNA 2-thiocytidine biosynthesis protein TtcA [Eubacterium sp.]|nr:tRNA 2-thiocytidine biosynthesis protein TtcA [Eubacterium sp.]
MGRELSDLQLIERSIIKKYRKEIWNPFIEGVKNYELVNDGDRIAVCISGGKDSMLMAKLMQQLKRVSNTDFDLVFLVMDPGYNAANRKRIEDNAKRLGIPITVFESRIFDVANSVNEGSPCYLCARMRRGHLYAKAKELGCNKIALGHHFTDVIETTLLGMFYGSQIQAMLPKLHSTNFEGMELIRPMYCVHEDDIIRWCNYNDLHFIQCACRFTDNYTNSADGIGESKRQEIKMLIKELRKTNPDIEHNIFKSIHSVCLDTMPGYKQGGEYHSFLDNYQIENGE